MKKHKIKLYLLIVTILFIGILYFSLKDNYLDILNALSNVNIFYLAIGILFVFLCRYFLAVTTYYLAKKEIKDVKMSKMFKICLIYPFFAGITPSSIGGESFEIFYLKDAGIPYGKATNITMQKLILYQISLIIVDTFVVILNFFTKIVPNDGLVTTTIILNFIVNISLLGASFFLVYNKKFNSFIMKKGILLLNKLHIIKDTDSVREKLDSYLTNFNEGAEKLKKDKKLFFQMVLVNIISLLFYYLSSIPIAKSLGIDSISMLNIFIIAKYSKMMCLLFVTPGNSGGAEYCFIYLFERLLSESSVMAYMLIWRLATYYIPLIVGGIIAISWGKEKKQNEQITNS